MPTASIKTERATTSAPEEGATAERARPTLRKRARKARRRVNAFLMRMFAPTMLRGLARTWRTDVIGQEHFDAVTAPDPRGEPDDEGNGGRRGFLLALWHGRMLVPFHHHRGLDMCVLVSPSDDGSLAVGMLERFGHRVIRGSSSRTGARAVREMLTELKTGSPIVITPDGPRGPRHSMNQGLAWLARATGFPILPCGFVCDRAWHLNSWDRFTIPRPGARLALVYGEPISVARKGEDLDRVTDEIARRMHAAEAAGFAHLGVGGDG